MTSGQESKRSPREVLLLAEAAQLATLVALVVDLGLPWVTNFSPNFSPVTVTAFSSTDAGPAVMILMALALVAVLIRRRWGQLTVAGLALVAAVMSPAQLRANSDDLSQSQPGVWLATVLLVVLAVSAVLAARALNDAGVAATAP